MSIEITNVKTTDLAPKIKNPAFHKYLPTRLTALRYEFDISPVSNAVSNALRRTLACEMYVERLHAEFDQLKTTDCFIIPEMVLNRLHMIPMDQTVASDATFELIASNDGAFVRDVKTSEMRIVNAGTKASNKQPAKTLPINGNITLCTLMPGTTLKISNITIQGEFGFVKGCGMYAMAVNCVSIAVDQQPINMYGDKKGLSSSIANPRHWRVGFTTNGELPPAQMVARACDNIIARISAVQSSHSITRNKSEYLITMHGESDTLGNLFMRAICELYPDIPSVNWSNGDIERICTLRIQCGDDDINIILYTAIKHIIATFTEIRKFFD
jgi:DNA-directed RNA polymerase subunit L